MEWQTIYSQEIYRYEQEEILETNLVAGEDGVVTEVVTVVQEHALIRGVVEAKQQIDPVKNLSIFDVQLLIYATAGENGDGFSFKLPVSDKRSSSASNMLMDDYLYVRETMQPYINSNGYTVAPGETKSELIRRFYSKSDVLVGELVSYEPLEIYHNLDGSLTETYRETKNNGYRYLIDFIFNGRFCVNVSGLLQSGQATTKTINQAYECNITDYIIPNDRAVYPITADNFTDEENPSFTYQVTSAKSFVRKSVYDEPREETDTVTSLQVGLSLDGETIDIDYREIAIDGTSYTFNLSEAERDLLRQRAQGSDTVPIYYMTKVMRELPGASWYEAQSALIVGKTQRYFTVVGCNPTLNPTVKDIKPETLALTGDENTFIRYESMAEFTINATASKGATIVSQSVTCGSKTISNLPNGVIDDVESGTFIFNITDSRSMGASSSVFKSLIDYVKPTCYQKLEVEITGETGATIKATVNGNYFNGSFGAADNTLKLEVRYTDGNDNWGEWKALSGTPTYNGNTYELEATFTGFDYGKAYIFQCRATDKLNVVQSSQYTIKMLPVFDWSETDFNFNVPVNIDAEDLNMHGKTIIRHSDTTNNTVLSASDGHIYIRPRGTDNTYNETIFYNNGNVNFSGNINAEGNATFGGTVSFDGSFSINGNTLNDYVIATGSEAMGSNGTWYWRKWASGTAEAWGCRNFGNMAITTAWGSLYRSAVLTQDLPDNVFIRTPDAININIVHSNFGGWICKHEQTAPSAATTGSFIFVRPASATVTPTNIGFYVVGEWK